MNVEINKIMTDNSVSQLGRNKYLDVVKYVLIFLVVWGHVIQQTSHLPTYPEQIDPLVRFIWTTHMPLFMGLCGYFFYKSLAKYNNAAEYRKNKLQQRMLGLFIPMLSFGFLKVLISMCEGEYDFTINNFLVYWLIQAEKIWFLGDLAINTIIMLCLWYFCNDNFSHDWKIIILGIPLACIPKLFNISALPHMYLYFALGFCCNMMRYSYIKIFNSVKYWLIALTIFICAYSVFSNLPWPPSEFIFTLTNHTIFNLIINDSLKIILGISGSYLVLLIVYKVYIFFIKIDRNNKLINKIACVGKYTLDIYLLQIIIVEYIFRIINSKYFLANGIDMFNFSGCFGMLMRIIITFIISIFLFEIIVKISSYINKNAVVKKILFYR